MELVEFFKDEVNSIVDHRPPVSKAKMAQITRAAIKATRFYKHVVMGVERFIERCPPEYKVAGLYVIDSIVRQSRHSNGKERDIFGPRFARNLHITFDNLFSGCVREDRPRIVRVLNLWQKNGVFNAKTIQPLLDLASMKCGSGAADKNSSLMDETTNSIGSNQNDLSQNTIAGNSSTDNNVLNMNNSTIGININNSGNVNNTVRISKSFLDFDYGEDDDDDANDDPDETPTEAEPPLSSTLSKIEMEQRRGTDSSDKHSSSKFHSRDRDLKRSPSNHNISMTKSNDPDPVLERWNKLMKGQTGSTDTPSSDGHGSQIINTTSSNSTQGTQSSSYSTHRDNRSNHNSSSQSSSNHHNHHNHHSKQHQHKQTARPTTPSSESPKRKSPSHSSSKNKINEAEKEAERRRKCFPKIKDRHVTLCSSTLWLGHVPKSVTEADISDAFGEFGTINSIDLIPPRGCSYVSMDRRQDAQMALSESRELRLKGSRIKMAWAPGKGLKEYKELKDYFELGIGCAFIPYSKITPNIDFDILEDGGVIDEDSLSMDMIESRKRKAKEKLEKNKKPAATNLAVPILPIMSQSLQPPFHLPPTSLANVPPPPNSAWVQSGIPYPPPRLATAETKVTQPSQTQNVKHDPTQSLEANQHGTSIEVPISLEHKISITEQQISMVEQQLNMMQQSQNSDLPSTLDHSMVGPQMLNHSEPFANPMIFDMSLTQGLAAMPPQLQMFSGPPPGLYGQPAPLIPMSQANQINMTMDGGTMHHYGGGF